VTVPPNVAVKAVVPVGTFVVPGAGTKPLGFAEVSPGPFNMTEVRAVIPVDADAGFFKVNTKLAPVAYKLPDCNVTLFV